MSRVFKKDLAMIGADVGQMGDLRLRGGASVLGIGKVFGTVAGSAGGGLWER